jgi:iron(III) transport system ATP-binding protein
VSAVVVRDLTKRFGERPAVEGASLEVGRGECVVVLGPSGSGKTTLLRLLAGLEAPDEGTIELFGERVAEPGRSVAPERRGVGMVFQDLALWPGKSVLDHVLFSIRRGRLGPSKAEERDRARRALEMLRLPGREKDLPHELSGGEAQRLALARAVAAAPRLLLLDEPLGSLDAPLRAVLGEEILRLRGATGATVVLVTHDRGEAYALGDRVAVMERGRILQVGTPHEVYREPATPFVAEFLGDVAWVRGVVDEDGRGVRTDLGRLETAASRPRATGTPVRVAARPEHAILGEGGVLAEVERRHFDGAGWTVHLRIGEDGLRLRARAEHPYPAGSGVHVRLAGVATVFPIESAADRERLGGPTDATP